MMTSNLSKGPINSAIVRTVMINSIHAKCVSVIVTSFLLDLESNKSNDCGAILEQKPELCIR